MYKNKEFGQYEKTKRYVPNKIIRQNHRKRNEQMEISSLQDKELKLMVLKMLIRLRRINEQKVTEIQMKNTIKRMNSNLDDVKE